MVRRLLPALLLGVTFLLAGSAWAVSSPPGSSPDDDYHLASIWCGWGASTDVCDEPSASPGTRLVRGDVVHAPCFAFRSETSGSCAYRLSDEPVPARTNADGSYPPLFYAAMRVFVGESVAASVVAMRLANVLLASLLLGAAVAVATPVLRRSVSLAWLGSAVPLGMFIVPSTNPSSWVVIGVGTYWAFLLRYLLGGRDRGTVVAGALAAVSALIAAGARADGAAFIGLSTVAVSILTSRRQDLRQPRLLLPLAVCIAAAWVFFSVGQSSAVSGVGSPDGAPVLPERGGLDLLLGNLYAYPGLLAGVFGQGWGFGWLDTFAPPGVAVLSAGAAMSLLVLSLPAYWRRKALAVGLVGLVLVALPIYVLQGSGNIVGENVQPRYLLPLVTLLLGLALLTRDGQPGWPLGRARTAALVLAVAAANAMALQSELRRYVTGNDVSSLRLDRGVEWWWDSAIGPMSVWVLGSMAGLALFTSLGWAAQLPVQRQVLSGPTTRVESGRRPVVMGTE